MRSNLNLVNLIFSLTPAEKKYFRKYAARHIIGEKNIYLRLFDEINKLKQPESYNERTIKVKLSKHSRIGNFSVLKSYLYEMLLKSMREYNAGTRDIDLIIHNHSEDSRILFRKRMINESYAALYKAKKTALKFERFEKLYYIIRNERKLVKATEPANIMRIENLDNELIETAGKITNTSQYMRLNDLTITISNKYGITDTLELKNRFGEILDNELLKDSKHAKTFYSLLYFYQIHSTYHFMLGEYSQALINYKKMITLYEGNENMMKENTLNYLLIIQNCIDACDTLKWDDEYNFYYNKFTQILKNKSISLNDSMKSYILSRSYILEIRKYTNSGNFNENNPGIITLKENFEANIYKFQPEERVILIFQFAMYYFGCSNYNESLKWLNVILNKEEELRRDLRIECRLLFLITHYELGNIDFLEYAVKSTYRYLIKQKTLKGIEPLILFFIKKISFVTGDKEMKELFIELKHKMINLNEALKDYAFNYQAWIESKISGQSFADVIKKNSGVHKKIQEFEER